MMYIYMCVCYDIPDFLSQKNLGRLVAKSLAREVSSLVLPSSFSFTTVWLLLDLISASTSSSRHVYSMVIEPVLVNSK